jgi:hypothetical protein
VNVLYGTLFSGLTSLNNQIWSQDSPGIDGMQVGDQIWTQAAPGSTLQTAAVAEANDLFGYALPN